MRIMFDDIFSTLHKKTSDFLTNVEQADADVEEEEQSENLDFLSVNNLSHQEFDTLQLEKLEIIEVKSLESQDNFMEQDLASLQGNSPTTNISDISDALNQSKNVEGEQAYLSVSPRTSQKMTNVDEHITSWIKNSLKLAEDISCDEIITALTELGVRWQLPGFRLAFVGEFSRGKSTLINCLLGRDLLPIGAQPTTGTLISMVAGGTEKMEVRTPEKGWEIRPIEEASWNDLLASEQDKDSHEKLTQVRLTLDHPWLRNIDVELIDTPGAGDLNSSRTALLCDIISRCDAAVILVSATLPFSMTEATFLEQEILGRHIPNVFVAVSRLDTVPQEQKNELLGVIRERVMEISKEVPIIPIHPLDADASEIDALERVRTQIESMVEKGERRVWRSRKVAGQLVDYLEHLVGLSESAIKSFQMNAVEKEQALRQIERERQDTELHWEDIRLNIDWRRLQHTQELRQKVLQAKEELVEVYSFELKKVKDLKGWWERDLPFKLRRALLSLGNRLSEDILTQLSSDFAWMKDEVAQKFSRQLIRNSPDLSTTVKLDADLSQLQLTDIRNYALLTSLGSSATAICSLIVGGGPVGLVVSTVSWFLSDQFIRQKTNEQRQRLSEELVLNLDRIADEYCNQMLERLKQLYNQMIEEIKQEQMVWQSAWESALRRSDDNTQDISHYGEIIEQASTLKQDIFVILSHSSSIGQSN
jgi:GTPase SAR1 family protein